MTANQEFNVPEAVSVKFNSAVSAATLKLSKYIHEDKDKAYKYIRMAIAALMAIGALVLTAVWTEETSKEVISKLFKAALAIWESS
jgi:hypothetical protein